MKKTNLGLTLLIGILILTLAVEFYSFNLNFFNKYQEKNNIADKAGITQSYMKDFNKLMVDYLRSKVSEDELEGHLSQREMLHMKDVLKLYKLVRLIKYLAFLSIIFLGIISFKKGNMSLVLLVKYLNINYILPFLFFLAIKLNFERAFIIFHKLLFNNELWLLDPKDILVNVYPESFFYQIGVRILVAYLFMNLFIQAMILIRIKNRKEL